MKNMVWNGLFSTRLSHLQVSYQAEQPEEDVTDLCFGKQVVTKFHTHQRLEESDGPEGKYNTDLKIVPLFCLLKSALAPSDGQDMSLQQSNTVIVL